MRFPSFLSLLSLPLLLVSCTPDTAPAAAPEQAKATDISEGLLGTWETVEIEVAYTTYQQYDTAFTQVIREADWGKLFGVRPARTEFTADGKLKRTHLLLGGEVSDITHGLWQARGKDSLLVIEPNKTLNYAHKMDGDRLTLTGTVDYDYDGEVDDNYRSVLRLVSRTQ